MTKTLRKRQFGDSTAAFDDKGVFVVESETQQATELPINQIVCGDNCEVMRTLPSESIDLVVTSPPYDDLRTYGGHSWDFEGVVQQLWRVIKPGGVVVWVVADATIDGSETGTSFRQALRFKEIGFRIHDTMIYRSSKPPLTHKRYEQEHEFMFVFVKGCLATFNGIRVKTSTFGQNKASRTMRQDSDELGSRSGKGFVAETRLKGNVWEIQCGFGHSSCDRVAFNHPAIFPEALARDHILSWSNEGEIVLDPFSGSGTTAKMAREMGRKYIGIEVNPEYVEISKTRLEQKLLF